MGCYHLLFKQVTVMKKAICVLSAIVITYFTYSQTLCYVIGGYTTEEYAKTFLSEERERCKNVDTMRSEIGSFQILDMCAVGDVRLIELRRANDTIGYWELNIGDDFVVKFPSHIVVATLDEEISSGERLEIGGYYQLKVQPYFPILRTVGDFYYPVLLGREKKVAVELLMPFHGNYYTSPNIIGSYYIP